MFGETLTEMIREEVETNLEAHFHWAMGDEYLNNIEEVVHYLKNYAVSHIKDKTFPEKVYLFLSGSLGEYHIGCGQEGIVEGEEYTMPGYHANININNGFQVVITIDFTEDFLFLLEKWDKKKSAA